LYVVCMRVHCVLIVSSAARIAIIFLTRMCLLFIININDATNYLQYQLLA
jgi:hypothetical protein